MVAKYTGSLPESSMIYMTKLFSIKESYVNLKKKDLQVVISTHIAENTSCKKIITIKEKDSTQVYF